MEFNIWNDKERKVRCVNNEDEGIMVCGYNNHLLEVGKLYTVVDVEVHSWHTLVGLEEFPDEYFNSVLFEEIDT